MDSLEAWKDLFDEPTQDAIDLTVEQASQGQSQSSRPIRASQRGSQRINRRPASSQASQAPLPSIQSLPAFVRSEYTPQHRRSVLRDSRGYFQLSVKNAWKVLNKYYSKLAESPLYAASVILHPGRGLRWLENRWSSPEQDVWLREAKTNLYNYWQRWYTEEGGSRPSSQPRGDFTSIGVLPRPEATNYRDWFNSQLIQASRDEGSELDQYCRMVIPQPVVDPIKWWIDHRQTFPTLSKLALDILAIPPMATDCERTFSLAKLTMTSQRLSMKPSRLEMVQCLKNWLRGGAVSLGNIFYPSKG